MIATLQPTPLDQWRRRFGGRRRRTQPRPFAAMGCLTDGPVVDNLIEIEKFTLVLLYDDAIRSGHCALRLAGYSGSRVPWGVRFGGQAGCRFVKDLALQPVPGGQGYRIDRADEELLRLALALNRQLDRDARFAREVRNRPFLPNLWAGFHAADAATITGNGPELAAYSERTGRSPHRLLEHLRRDHHDLVLHPLAWVSHHWRQAATIFADLDRFPRRQVFRLENLPDDLVGFHDAAEFDFASRFTSGPQQRSRHRRQPVLASAV